MNRKEKIIVSIAGIFLVLFTLLGLAYAYFLTQIPPNTEEKSISIETVNLELEYGDGNGILEVGDKLRPGNPVNFKSNGATVNEKTFTVTNNGDVTSYVVIVDNVSVTKNGVSTTFETNDFKYTLTCKSYDKEAYQTNGDSSPEDGKCSNVTSSTFPLENKVILITNRINSGLVHKYSLTMEYLDNGDDQSDDMGKTFSAKIDIADIGKMGNPYEDNKNSLAYNIINNSLIAKNGTKLESAPLTRVAEEINLENEKVLSVAADDHGNSYYFRGNVIDNYVNFAGMCWRIVRIQGDGSVKLILEDQYTTCDDDETSDTDTVEYTGEWSIGTFNYGHDYDSYDNQKLNYLTPQNKGMSEAFKNYQTTTLSNKISTIYENKGLDDYLKIGDWCLDDSVYSDELGTNRITDLSTYYSEEIPFYYGAYTRINGKKEVTLKCPVDTMEKFGDNTTPMYIATLTADEIVYAGGKYDENNLNNYLINQNAYLSNFWLLSPDRYNSVYESIFYLQSHGSLKFNYPYIPFSIRPSISLKAGIEIINGGEGRIDNPYVIK